VLLTRILSALVMAPVALAAAWFGGLYFVALVTAAGVALAWEWSRLIHGKIGAAGWILVAGAAVLPLVGWLEPLRGVVLVGVTAILAAAAIPLPGRSRWWMPLGAIYILLPQFALITIREQGRGALLWALMLVWATDSAAYFSGRLIGGPKLAPRISPNKTWAGLFGGMLAAGMVGWAMGARDPGNAMFLASVSALLAVVAQTGDLTESGLKRYFGVKDSSNLIPGHGGVFDRLDGVLFVAPVVAILLLSSAKGWGALYGW
jgi:phosphatidate cytidylyltransferase